MDNKKNNKLFAIFASIIYAGLILLVGSSIPLTLMQRGTAEATPAATLSTGALETQGAIPAYTPLAVDADETERSSDLALTQPPGMDPAHFSELYPQLNPGVVHIQVLLEEQIGGGGSGSGFILDEQGHILTNNHVVAHARRVTVVFYNKFEAQAEVIGTDQDSDLAVLRVDELAEGAHPLSLGDSQSVIPGQWVLAIGSPFGLGSSITVGVVSAVGRAIPAGVVPFSIPEAIQTDAAINPGNSGGPLLDLEGRVIGVNAQIASPQGTQANAGVGFAIPVNVVRRVAPVLIQQGSFQWPWIGLQTAFDVDLAIQEGNNLDTQQGVYIHRVVQDAPVDQAGLQGSSGTTTVGGIDVPTDGDVIIAVDGERVIDSNDLLAEITARSPGDSLVLTILRSTEADRTRQEVQVELEPRPQEFNMMDRGQTNPHN